MGWVEHAARKGCRTRVHGVLLENLKESDNLGRHRLETVRLIKMNPQETRWEGGGWSDLARAFVNAVMNIWVP
jgi:hypothetical protein